MKHQKPKIRALTKYNKPVEDAYFAKIEFTDPDTGEALYGNFKLWRWYKPPQHIADDINQRLKCPIQNVAGKVDRQGRGGGRKTRACV